MYILPPAKRRDLPYPNFSVCLWKRHLVVSKIFTTINRVTRNWLRQRAWHPLFMSFRITVTVTFRSQNLPVMRAVKYSSLIPPEITLPTSLRVTGRIDHQHIIASHFHPIFFAFIWTSKRNAFFYSFSFSNTALKNPVELEARELH